MRWGQLGTVGDGAGAGYVVGGVLLTVQSKKVQTCDYIHTGREHDCFALEVMHLHQQYLPRVASCLCAHLRLPVSACVEVSCQ